MDGMFIRNAAYINDTLQDKLSTIHILIAGCGLGSYIAEALVRMGCQRLTLVDHDTIELHNLNRQDFMHADVGNFKTIALKNRLLSINPEANIKTFEKKIEFDTVETVLQSIDVVIDTIDFLSVDGLMALYEYTYQHKIAMVSALSAGWGAIGFYIPAERQTKNWFKAIFHVDDESCHQDYVYYFEKLVKRITPYLPDEVNRANAEMMAKMKENKPCPASQLSVGAMAAASLCATLLCRHLSESEMATLPYAMLVDMERVAMTDAILFV
jgi:molybdopterin/thiamine biosynthesis adenylyltransferase